MRYIKLVNEENHINYGSSDDLYDLLCYVFRFNKTCYDEIRSKYACFGNYMGCEPFLLPRIYETDPEVIFKYMMLHYFAYGKHPKNMAKHRVIDFSPDEIVLAHDLDALGRRIAHFYERHGYIAAYAVHMDEYHLHIHVVISTVGYYDGRAFHIPYEYNQLLHVVQKWQEDFNSFLDSNPSEYEARERSLFGDPLKYGEAPFTARDQIRCGNKS